MIDPISSLNPNSISLSTVPDTSQNGGQPAPEAIQPKAVTSMKSLFNLAAGEVFTAQIVDIAPVGITLRLADGATLTAKALKAPDARIGDAATFVVRENGGATGGALVLEFLRGAGDAVPASIVREALGAANMQITPENNELINRLVMHNMPIDSSTIQRAAFFSYTMGAEADFDDVVFLIQNKFAPIQQSVDTFAALKGGELNLQNEAAKLNALLPLNNLSINIEDGENTGAYLQRLSAALSELDLTSLSEGARQEATQTIQNIQDIIDFGRNIEHNKHYMPFIFGANQEHNGELHVFHDKGHKRRANKKQATALLALDMAHLGHMEVYIVRNGGDVSLQFRSDKNASLKMVHAEGDKLIAALQEKGIRLSSLVTKTVDEKFTIDKDQEGRRPATAAPISDKRYSFDMRV